MTSAHTVGGADRRLTVAFHTRGGFIIAPFKVGLILPTFFITHASTGDIKGRVPLVLTFCCRT